jgi:protein gp37
MERPKVIFTDSMSDLFHERIPEPFIQQVFERVRVYDARGVIRVQRALCSRH